MTLKKITFVVAIFVMMTGMQAFLTTGYEENFVGWPFFLVLLGGGLLGYSSDAFTKRDKDE